IRIPSKNLFPLRIAAFYLASQSAIETPECQTRTVPSRGTAEGNANEHPRPCPRDRRQRLRGLRGCPQVARPRLRGARARAPDQPALPPGGPPARHSGRRSARSETVRPAMAGVRYVFHVAADYRLWARDRNEILANNLSTTRIVMEEALRAGAERIVYTSSVATLAVRRDGTSVDETFPLDEAKAIGVYKRSKIVAERLVERMIAEQKLPAVIVNPSTPIGPRDVKPTPTG